MRSESEGGSSGRGTPVGTLLDDPREIARDAFDRSRLGLARAITHDSRHGRTIIARIHGDLGVRPLPLKSSAERIDISLHTLIEREAIVGADESAHAESKLQFHDTSPRACLATALATRTPSSAALTIPPA